MVVIRFGIWDSSKKTTCEERGVLIFWRVWKMDEETADEESCTPAAGRRELRRATLFNKHKQPTTMPETTEQKIEKAKEAEKKIKEALEKHGVGGFWAKLISSVIIAAVAIAVGMFATSCTVSYTKLPDGTVTAQGSVVKPVHVTK